MPTKKTNKNNWKNLVQDFVGNVMEQLSDNVSQKVNAWIKIVKRKTVGSILMSFGLLYLLIGLSVYFNSILSPILPGLGYVTVGVLAILIGSLVFNNKA